MTRKVQIPPGEDDPGVLTLEMELYIFVRRLRKARQAYERIEETPEDGFRIPWAEGAGGPLEYYKNHHRASLEFVVVMVDFLRSDAVMNVDDIFNLLTDLDESNSTRRWAARQRNDLARLANAPPQLSGPSGEQMSARQIFLDLCKNVIFGDDTEAYAFVDGLREDPEIEERAWGKFHNYCLAVYEALEDIQLFIRENDLYPGFNASNKCIFCRETQGPFTVEHIIPESLGNQSRILPRGYVCKNCNGQFSDFEGEFLNRLPVNLVRTFATFITKQGRFPSTKFGKIHFHRTSPNTLRAESHAGETSLPDAFREPDGSLRLDMPAIQDEFDHEAAARTLHKMSLETIALQEGREAALDSKYDPSRQFVLDGGTFQGWLMLKTELDPRPGHEFAKLGCKGGTGFLVDLLGVIFLVGIEPIAGDPPPAPDEAPWIGYDLQASTPGPHVDLT